MAAEWQRVVSTTLINFLRKEENNIMRNRKVSALVKEKGRVTYGWSGRLMEQRIRFRRVAMVGYADMDIVTFARQQRWKEAQLDWRGYSLADAVTKKERLMNKGQEAIIKLFSDLGGNLKDDMQDQFCDEYYIDGNATGNTKRMHGIESFMGQPGSQSVSAGYKSPSDSFAGLNTDLQSYGGTWTGTWPDGTGDAHYDFWAPILLDYTHASAWSAGATWILNCLQTIGNGITQCQRGGVKDGMLDLIVTTGTMYAQAKDKVRGLEHVNVDRGQQSKLVSLGFRDVLNVDGVDVTWEYGVPASTAYGFNMDKMETRSLQDQLFVVEGPDWDPSTKSYRLSLDFFGNTWWNPRYFLKMKNYT